jgi:hypothetical protein
MDAHNKWDSSKPNKDWSNPDPTDSDYMKSRSSFSTTVPSNP